MRWVQIRADRLTMRAHLMTTKPGILPPRANPRSLGLMIVGRGISPSKCGSDSCNAFSLPL
jgi:hypothetical protein